MRCRLGDGTTEYGPGVLVELTGDEVATAVDAFLVAHGVVVRGPRTVRVNGRPCEAATVYVDPCGFVVWSGERIDGGSGEGVAACDKKPCEQSASSKPY